MLRDDKGIWVGGFSGHPGAQSVLFARLRCIKHGLTLAWSKGYKRVWCECDSFQALRLVIATHIIRFHVYADVVQDIKSLVAREWQVCFSHIWRKANICVDAMARLGSETINSLRIWDSPPDKIVIMLSKDSEGVIIGFFFLFLYILYPKKKK